MQIFSTLNIAPELLARLTEAVPEVQIHQKPCRSPQELPDLKGVEVLYTYNVLPLPEQVPDLRWIQLHSAGADHLLGHPLLEARPDLIVTTASGVHAVPMAEYVFGVLLALTRRVPRMVEDRRLRRWPRGRWDRYLGPELRGMTLLVVGYGSIGREVARLGRAFGMRVLAVKGNPARREDPGWREPGVGDPDGSIPERIYGPQELPEALAQADVTVVVVPKAPSTAGLLSREVLASVRPGSYLINVARGGIVDEAALLDLLREGRLAGVALDVFEREPLPPDDPLYAYEGDNLLLSPHVSGFTPRYDERCMALFAENLRRYVRGEPLLNRFDLERGY